MPYLEPVGTLILPPTILSKATKAILIASALRTARLPQAAAGGLMDVPAAIHRLEFVIAYDPLLLLERAAGGFFQTSRSTASDPFPSPPYLLALRQGGLRDDLIALAADRGISGWFDPPLCIFHELPEWLGTTDRTPCDDFERAVVLGGVLRRLGGEVFGRLHRPEDFITALDRLFGELVAEDVTPAAFEAALESNSDRDAFERQRDMELALAYGAYLEALERDRRRDGRDTWSDCARALATDPAALAERLGGRREIRIFGLQDLRGGWRILLRALGASPAIDRVIIYSAGPLDLELDSPPAVIRLDEQNSIAARLFAGQTTPEENASKATVQVVSAPDVERELEEVARRVRALADGGVPLARIAVVTRQARPFVELALSALEKAGVPATARRRFALGEISAVRALRALLAAAGEGWSRHGIVELAEQPYIAAELDPRILNFAGFRRRVRGLSDWQRALTELACEAERDEECRRVGDEADDHRRPLPPALRCREAADEFESFARLAAPLDQSRTLAEWLEWLEDFLAKDPWGVRARIYDVPGRRFEIARLDLAGWKAVGEIVGGWCRALDQWGGAADRLGVGEFYAQLADLLDGDVALWTETTHGVQVLEGLAAAYRSFDHLFLVGLEAGCFPLPARGSPILDERERQALRVAGLPLEPREAWDARERELFRVLVGGARKELTVSYARLDSSGREAIRSTFVEALGDVARLAGAQEGEEIPASRVVIAGIRLYADSAAGDAALRAAGIEWDRRSGRLSPHNGLIEDPELLAFLAQEFGDDRLWSPTQLESFAKCPWSYFSSRLLHVDRLADPDEEMDSATRGSLLHDALRRFYALAREPGGKPVFLRSADLTWTTPLVVAALDATLADARGRSWLGNALLLPAKREELRRLLVGFVEWEVREHEDMYLPKNRNAPRMVRTGVVEHEHGFQDVVLERGGVRFRFRGSVDRVEVGVDDRCDASRLIAAVDYKTTVGSTPGGGHPGAWEDGVVLQVPLYAYALAQTRPGTETARVEYRAIKQTKAVHSLQLYQFDRKSKSLVRDEEAVAKMDAALDRVAQHVLRVRRGEFPAEPAESCGCPPFCHALEICRLPGGPRSKGR